MEVTLTITTPWPLIPLSPAMVHLVTIEPVRVPEPLSQAMGVRKLEVLVPRTPEGGVTTLGQE